MPLYYALPISWDRAVPDMGGAAVKGRIVRALLTDISSLRLCRIVLADGVWRGRVVRRRNNVQAKETMAPGEPITRPGAGAFRRSRPGTVGCMVSHPGCRCSLDRKSTRLNSSH